MRIAFFVAITVALLFPSFAKKKIQPEELIIETISFVQFVLECYVM
jgi:hypothetical protein